MDLLIASSLEPKRIMEETVSCFCNGCSTELGQFRNAWNVIGHNYYSPVYPVLTYDDGFMGLGDVRSVKLGSHAAWYVELRLMTKSRGVSVEQILQSCADVIVI